MIINVTDDASNVIKGKVGNGLNLFLTLRVRVILLRTGVGHGFIIISGLSWYPRVTGTQDLPLMLQVQGVHIK